MKVLVFDFYADYGHFKKIYTTTSPLTYSIIPPTAIYGIISAFLGLEKENNRYLEIINADTTMIAEQIINPIKKVRHGLNLINTKGNIWIPKQRTGGARTLIRTEFLKNPSYRLYVNLKDEELFNKLICKVKEHKNYFTLSMGLSELLANFSYVDLVEFNKTTSITDFKNISSVVPYSKILDNGIDIESGKSYYKERLPINMDKDRIVSSYEEIIMEMNGQPIRAKVGDNWVNESGENIVFF